MKKYYRVKTGYGKNDFISIDETELVKAVNAQVTGKIALLKEGTVAGNNIMQIIPDYNRVAGYYPDYVMTGDDFSMLPSGTKGEHMLALENAVGDVQARIDGHVYVPIQAAQVKDLSGGAKQIGELLKINKKENENLS